MMGRAGIAYTTGFMAIATALPYMLGMFIFSGYAGRIQQVGEKYHIESIPSLFEYRFGKPAKCVLAAMVAFAMVGTVAAQVTATATIIKLLGGQVGISYEMGAFIATAIFIIYTAASGLFGVVYTDVVQFFMLIIFVYLMIPFSSLDYLGGFGSFWASLDKSYITPAIDGKILGDIVTYLVFTMAGAEMWQRAFAAKDKKSAKRGMFWGTAVYGVTIALLFLMGLAAQQILPNVVEEFGTADAVIPALAIKILPPGLTGLALSGILSVMMSTADSYLLVSVQTVVSDLGKTFHPAMKEKQEILFSRIASVVLALGALVIALYIKSAYDVLMFAWAFYAAAAGLPALAALYWKKATSAGIMAGMLGGLRGHRGLEAGGRAHGSGCRRPRRHRLRRPAGGSQPGHIPEAPHCDGGSEISVPRRGKRDGRKEAVCHGQGLSACGRELCKDFSTERRPRPLFGGRAGALWKSGMDVLCRLVRQVLQGGEGVAHVLPRVSSSSRISALVREVEWSSTMAPLWMRGMSLEKASSAVGWSSTYQST